MWTRPTPGLGLTSAIHNTRSRAKPTSNGESGFSDALSQVLPASVEDMDELGISGDIPGLDPLDSSGEGEWWARIEAPTGQIQDGPVSVGPAAADIYAEGMGSCSVAAAEFGLREWADLG